MRTNILKRIVCCMLIVFVYIMSCIYAKETIRNNYLNRWKHINPTFADIIMIYIPFVNTLCAIDGIIGANVDANKILDIPVRK
jgi:hypothetical protein